jgi:photosystem II stability/assembly factor-like uncharacterized protein
MRALYAAALAVCIATPAFAQERCFDSSQCNDGNPCTVDSCDGPRFQGFCSHRAVEEGTSCNLLDGKPIRAIAVHPAKPNVVVIGTEGGELLRSTDSGATWVSGGAFITQAMPIVFAPSNPSIVYAGSYMGVVKSTDEGATWQLMALTSRTLSVAVDPADANVVYAGTYYEGFYKSTDGGAHWTAIGAGLPYGAFPSLALDPRDSSAVWVVVSGDWSTAPNGPLIYKSTDAGASFTASGSGLTGIYAGPLAIDPHHPDTMYVGTAYNGSFCPGVFRTTNGGSSWTRVGAQDCAAASFSGPDWFNSFRSLAVDPISPAIVYAASNTGLFRSADGGDNWEQVSGITPISDQLHQRGNDNVASVAVDAAGKVYAGTGGAGLFSSNDGIDYAVPLNGSIATACHAGACQESVAWSQPPQIAVVVSAWTNALSLPVGFTLQPGYAPPEGVTIAQVDYFLDGARIYSGPPEGAPAALDLTLQQPGAHLFGISAADNLGNAMAQPATAAFTYAPDVSTLQLFGLLQSLQVKLAAAAAALQRGNTKAAAGSLGAFANEVAAMVRSGRISDAMGAALSADAAWVIAHLT